jgi:hypothetical protein
MHLDTLLEVLGLHSNDVPRVINRAVNIHNTFGKDPIARLFFTDSGFTLRFGAAVSGTTSVEQLPTGGIRVAPLAH